MTTDLRQSIQDTFMVDIHEHIIKEADYVDNGRDVIQALFHILNSNLQIRDS